MIVVVDRNATDAQVRLDAPDEFRAFHVEVVGQTDGLDEVLRAEGVGRMDGDQALVEIDALRRLAGAAATAAWEQDLSAMVDYAKGKGWVREEALQAHVESRTEG
jgi:hypothetical protein